MLLLLLLRLDFLCVSHGVEYVTVVKSLVSVLQNLSNTVGFLAAVTRKVFSHRTGVCPRELRAKNATVIEVLTIVLVHDVLVLLE